MVFFETPVIRTVELMELPSSRHRTSWARRSVSILFILTLLLARAGKVNLKMHSFALLPPFVAAKW